MNTKPESVELLNHQPIMNDNIIEQVQEVVYYWLNEYGATIGNYYWTAYQTYVLGFIEGKRAARAEHKEQNRTGEKQKSPEH